MYAAVTITLLALCTWRLEIDWGLILANFQVSVVRFTKTYLPMDFSQLREQLYQLWITVVISIAGAFVGMLLAFFSALAISSKTSRYRVLKYLVRALASLTRKYSGRLSGRFCFCHCCGTVIFSASSSCVLSPMAF